MQRIFIYGNAQSITLVRNHRADWDQMFTSKKITYSIYYDKIIRNVMCV